MNDSTSPWVRKLAIVYATLVAVGIAIAAFVLSFSALWDVATRVWPNRHLSWLGPAIVDSTILQATVSLVVVAHSTRSAERTYFWSLLIGAALTSIAGNALHAIIPAGQPLPGVVAALIATIPPVFLLLSTHSLTLLIRRRPAGDVAGLPQPAAAAATDAVELDNLNRPDLVAPELDELTTAAVGETQAAQPGRFASTAAHVGARPFLEPARALREQHNFDTPTSQIAAILHRFTTNPDSSKRELGLAGNVHHNTAAKIVNAYEESQLTLSNTRS